jgi:hypothetical protein
MRISSRPETEEQPGLMLEWLTEHELELISSLLWITRLGTRSPYSNAATTLMNKIERLRDTDFGENSAIKVDLEIDIIDAQGFVTSTVGYRSAEIVV